MQVYRVEHGAPHIVLLLVVCAIANAHRPRALVPTQVVERLLAQLVLPAYAVHDLKLLLSRRHVGDEIEEVICLPRETKRVEAPQHEGAVAYPRVPVVPVALASDGLGKRRRRSGEQRAGRAVSEPFESERASLQEALPRMLGKLAAVDPLAPEVGGSLDAVESLVHIHRGR